MRPGQHVSIGFNFFIVHFGRFIAIVCRSGFRAAVAFSNSAARRNGDRAHNTSRTRSYWRTTAPQRRLIPRGGRRPPAWALRSGDCRSPELTNIEIGRDRPFRRSFLMATQLGGMPPESLARLLMWELANERSASRKEIAPDPGGRRIEGSTSGGCSVV